MVDRGIIPQPEGKFPLPNTVLAARGITSRGALFDVIARRALELRAQSWRQAHCCIDSQHQTMTGPTSHAGVNS